MQIGERSERGAEETPRGGPPSPLPQTFGNFERLKGRRVHSADGVWLGTVAHIYHPLRYQFGVPNHHYLLVTRCRWTIPFVAHRRYVPETALASITSERVTLTLRHAQIRGQGWTRAPPDPAWFHRG